MTIRKPAGCVVLCPLKDACKVNTAGPKERTAARWSSGVVVKPVSIKHGADNVGDVKGFSWRTVIFYYDVMSREASKVPQVGQNKTSHFHP